MIARSALDEAAAWLAAGLEREITWRTVDGRLPPGADRDLDRRLGELRTACRERAAVFRERVESDFIARRLAAMFALDKLDLDLLYLATAAQREPSLTHALAVLRPPAVEAPLHVSLLAALATDGADTAREAIAKLRGDAVLARYNLLGFGLGSGNPPHAARAVVVPEAIEGYLEGGELADLDRGLYLAAVPHAREPRAGSPEWNLARCLVERGLATHDSPIALALRAPPGSGHERFAANVADQLGSGLLALDLDLAGGDPCKLDDRVRSAVRDAQLRNALFVITGLERIEDGERSSERRRRLLVVARALATCNYRLPFFVAIVSRIDIGELGRDVVTIEIPVVPPEQRVELFHEALEAACASSIPSSLEDAQVARIARSYPLPPPAIEAAARAAVRAARGRVSVREGSPLDEGDLLTAVRAQLEHRMSSLADPVRHRIGFDELVLEPDAMARLREIASYVCHAETVYDRWGFATRTSSRGVSALFSGPPGTGKTLGASALATELGLELFRIDLSRVVSKYIGETESNLARVFDEAGASRAILLFDEADALFGKRTEIKSSVDRYANMEINYLLQRVEAFDGISILTTNLDKAMDEAFSRRIHFQIRFEPPDEAMRAALWRRLIPSAAEQTCDIDFRALGRRFVMAGGNIRNAALRAGFLAASRRRPIEMSCLLEAAEREVEQMGRVTQTGSLG